MKKSKLVQITRQNEIAEDEFNPCANSMQKEVWNKLFSPQILLEDLSKTVSDNVITPFDQTVPDCDKCGGCCAAFVCVDVLPTDKIPPKYSWNIFGKSKSGNYLVDRSIKRKEEDFSCVALEGTIGKKVSCRIYKNRPMTCQNFEAGSDRCHAVRRAYGIEPFLDLMELDEAIHRLEEARNNKDNNKIDTANIIEDEKTTNLLIFVTLNDASEHLIHTFRRNVETWFKSEFEGLTLTKAKALVASRKQFR